MRSDVSALFGALLVAVSPPVLAATTEGGLLGPSVGNADTFISEGTKLYNQKAFAKAADNFLKATRASPASLPAYLQLARSLLAAKQVQRACYAYRVYLKASAETPDRKKAQAESDQCERQLSTAKNQPADKTQAYVVMRAAFFASLDRQAVLGDDAAYESLKALVNDGYLGPELGDMGAKLGAAAVAAADDIHKRALAAEKLPIETLKSARAMYHVATDVGANPTDAPARSAFLDGLAALQSKEYKKAEALFADAAKQSAGFGSIKEYVFCRGLALFQAGDKKGALKVLETDLKDDPRTETLRAALAMGESSEAGAAELERLLFSRRYTGDNK